MHIKVNVQPDCAMHVLARYVLYRTLVYNSTNLKHEVGMAGSKRTQIRFIRDNRIEGEVCLYCHNFLATSESLIYLLLIV